MIKIHSYENLYRVWRPDFINIEEELNDEFDNSMKQFSDRFEQLLCARYEYTIVKSTKIAAQNNNPKIYTIVYDVFFVAHFFLHPKFDSYNYFKLTNPKLYSDHILKDNGEELTKVLRTYILYNLDSKYTI